MFPPREYIRERVWRVVPDSRRNRRRGHAETVGLEIKS